MSPLFISLSAASNSILRPPAIDLRYERQISRIKTPLLAFGKEGLTLGRETTKTPHQSFNVENTLTRRIQTIMKKPPSTAKTTTFTLMAILLAGIFQPVILL